MPKLLEQYQNNAWARSVARHYDKMSWQLKTWFIITHYVNRHGWLLALASSFVALYWFFEVIDQSWIGGEQSLISDSSLWPELTMSVCLSFVFRWILPGCCNVIFGLWFDTIKKSKHLTTIAN
jgi:hypothetical protein